MNETATLVLWRHGTTDWNTEHRYQGRNADTTLNATGLAQAAAAASGVAAWQPAAIVCSPLTRARQTAAAVEALLGRACTTDDRLAEIDVGAWSGLVVAEAPALDPAFAAARAAGLDYRIGQTGETSMELGARVGEALRDAARDGETTLVVSHGWALQMGTANVLGWDYALSRGLAIMGNCRVSVLTRTRGRWRLDRWNTAG
ncbi:MAG: histidine phosphatase family protein [Propionibacteriaceae bacterium]|nr:histidine phosphatase family protein [Propionibacteriaceae bacterium]